MGVLTNKAKEVYRKDREINVCEENVGQLAMPGKLTSTHKDSSQFQSLCESYNRELEKVSTLIYKLDELLEPIYFNDPTPCEEDKCAEESYYGNTSLNSRIAEMASSMRLVRYNLEKIVGNINLL